MAKLKITLSDVAKKHLKIVAYLVASAVLAYVLSLVADNEKLILLAPAINYILYIIKLELDKEGVVQALKN